MKDKKLILKCLLGIMSLFMFSLAIITSLKSDMFHLSPVVLNEPWFQTTMVDFYFNITIISLWVIYKEQNLLKAALWILSFVLLGSITTSLYVLLKLLELKPEEPWGKVFTR